MSKETTSRRQFIKALLAAGGGITAAAFLPNQWVKPLVNTGVLPVHAATSVTYHLEGNTHDGRYVVSAVAGDVTGIKRSSGLASPAKFPSGECAVTLNGIAITMFYEGTLTPAPLASPVTQYTESSTKFGCSVWYDTKFIIPCDAREFNWTFSSPGSFNTLLFANPNWC